MAGTELATAYFTLLPSMKGTAAAVQSQLGGVELAAATAGSKAGTAMGGGLLAGVGKVIPILGGILLGAGIVDVFSDSVAAASDLNESANAVRVTFGEVATEIERLGTTAADRLGLSKNQFNGIATQFSAFAGRIAGDGGSVVGVIDELTTRGADFASVYNLDVADALALFQSGLAGETEPLRRYGIDISAAAVETYAYANGIGQVGTDLTETEKVQARYGLLLQETSATQGDFAETSDGLANSQRILAANFEDSRAKLGDALLPAMQKFTDFALEKGVPLLDKLVDVFIELEPVIVAVADATIGFLGYIADNLTALATFFTAFKDGKISMQEALNILGQFPDAAKFAIFAVANLPAQILNPIIGGLNGLIGAIEGVFNALLSAGGARISLPRIPGLGMLSVGGAGGGGGRAPFKAADGAYVPATAGGSLLQVGEGRDNEVVLPLRSSVLAEIGAAIPGNGGAVYVENPFTGEYLLAKSAEVARGVVKQRENDLLVDEWAGGTR